MAILVSLLVPWVAHPSCRQKDSLLSVHQLNSKKQHVILVVHQLCSLNAFAIRNIDVLPPLMIKSLRIRFSSCSVIENELEGYLVRMLADSNYVSVVIQFFGWRKDV